MNFDWRKLYDRAYDWIVIYGPKIVVGVIVFIIGMMLLRVLNRTIKKTMERRKVNLTIRYFLQNLIAITLQIILLVIVLQIIGLQLTVLSAIIAGITVAAGLALSGTLQNFVSGILILVQKPYRVGDTISAQGQEGTVKEIQIFYTTVMTHDNKTIIIPNGQLSNNVVVNLSTEGKRRLDFEMKFNYGVDVEKAKSLMLKAATDQKNLMQDPPPRVGITNMEADRYTLTLNVWTKVHGFYDIRTALFERIIAYLVEGGIQLPGMKD